MKNFTIFGTGAIGAYYGAKLAKAGNAVNFLARSDYDAIRKKGLTILSPDGDIHLNSPAVYQSPNDIPPSDVLIISSKTTSNKNIRNALSSLVSEKTVILIMQNGLGMEEEMQQWFPHNPVLGGMCFICARKNEPGVVAHLDKGSITLGALDKNYREQMHQLVEIFNKARISSTGIDNLREARWRKLLWNIPFNGLSVVLNGNTKELLANMGSRKAVESLMHEVISGAAACGSSIETEAVEKMIHYTDQMIPYEPSMKLDFLAKRPMEIEYIYDKPVQTAEAAGYQMKNVQLLSRQLRFIEQKCLQN